MTSITELPLRNGTNGTLASKILDVRTKDGIKFGKELRERDFMFVKSNRNMNHGSFGAFPRVVLDASRHYQDLCEARPDHYIRYEYPELLDQSREAMANLLNTPSSTLVFVPNASTGVDTVLRNLVYAPGDHIIYFSCIYGACEKMIAYLSETTPVKPAKINFTLPVEDEFLLDAFKAKVQEIEANGGKVKVAVFDTVVSMPGVRFPYEKMTEACRESGVLSLLDAAHAVGQIDLDVGKLDPDFLVSNCHKWLHVPRGCAIFHVALRHQDLIRTSLPTSHGFIPKGLSIGSPFPKSAFVDAGKSPWVGNFEFVGTIDNAPYLCIPKALQWRESLGGEEVVRNYCIALAQEGAKLLASKWGTKVLDNSKHTMIQCSMNNVQLPIDVEAVFKIASEAGEDKTDVGPMVRDWMGETASREYGNFVQTFWYGGEFWTRVSGQVYLDMEDFEWLADTMQKISDRVNAGEWLKPVRKS